MQAEAVDCPLCLPRGVLYEAPGSLRMLKRTKHHNLSSVSLLKLARTKIRIEPQISNRLPASWRFLIASALSPLGPNTALESIIRADIWSRLNCAEEPFTPPCARFLRSRALSRLMASPSQIMAFSPGPMLLPGTGGPWRNVQRRLLSTHSLQSACQKCGIGTPRPTKSSAPSVLASGLTLILSLTRAQHTLLPPSPNGVHPLCCSVLVDERC